MTNNQSSYLCRCVPVVLSGARLVLIQKQMSFITRTFLTSHSKRRNYPLIKAGVSLNLIIKVGWQNPFNRHTLTTRH